MTHHIEAPPSEIARWSLAAVSGFIAFWAIAGFVGLVGGGADLSRDVTERVPLQSPALAGTLLLIVVGIPMTSTCAMAVARPGAVPAMAMLSGITLLAWVCVQPIIIGQVHWLQPAFGLLGSAVALLGAAMRGRRFRFVAQSARPGTSPGR
ncbi:hypothetical protein [Nocardia cyriacigeorgica]|uniref:hypothetical protein n=1 Tax=Nocardia cyriacigeorgica TaxID=135487 RepID=UPI0005600A89|nr:hypothetical protein [Nocardia cyriacigeorgica]BDU05967.1 hypothetical protein FMUBM48_22300 [Nocardia cyriacigeorgica]